jgi:hypothetical protein
MSIRSGMSTYGLQAIDHNIPLGEGFRSCMQHSRLDAGRCFRILRAYACYGSPFKALFAHSVILLIWMPRIHAMARYVRHVDRTAL